MCVCVCVCVCACVCVCVGVCGGVWVCVGVCGCVCGGVCGGGGCEYDVRVISFIVLFTPFMNKIVKLLSYLSERLYSLSIQLLWKLCSSARHLLAMNQLLSSPIHSGPDHTLSSE